MFDLHNKLPLTQAERREQGTKHSGSPLPAPAQRRHCGQQMHAGHTPPHSPFIHPALPPPPGSATSLPPRPGTPQGRCQHTAPHASDPQVPSVLPGAELPRHPALSAAANYPPRKMLFKLVRAYSRRLPSNAPATASKCRCCVSPGSGGEPRERWLRSSRHSWLLPTAAASPVPRLQKGRREGQVMSAWGLAASAEPHRVLPDQAPPSTRNIRPLL